jgi:hypothetical protein
MGLFDLRLHDWRGVGATGCPALRQRGDLPRRRCPARLTLGIVTTDRHPFTAPVGGWPAMRSASTTCGQRGEWTQTGAGTTLVRRPTGAPALPAIAPRAVRGGSGSTLPGSARSRVGSPLPSRLSPGFRVGRLAACRTEGLRTDTAQRGGRCGPGERRDRQYPSSAHPPRPGPRRAERLRRGRRCDPRRTSAPAPLRRTSCALRSHPRDRGPCSTLRRRPLR